MRAGVLRQRVTIQKPVVIGRDSFGAEILGWEKVATLWADVQPLSGREYFDAQQMNNEVTTLIRIRYYPGITPQMQVVWNNHTYNIQAVLDQAERKREVHLMCKEVI